MPYARAEAIVIRSIDYSESSLVLSLFTREFGRVSALAKGAKRKSSKLTGHVDLFCHSEIILSLSGRRERLNILTEADVVDEFTGVRKSLPRYCSACHAAELVQFMTAQDDPSPELFEQLLAFLRAIETGRDPALSLFLFEARLLVLSGFMPQLGACVVCGAAMKQKPAAFSASIGGVVCAKCAPGQPFLIPKIPAGVLSLFERLASGKLTKLGRISVSPQAVKQMRHFLDQYESHVIGRELRSAKCF